MATVWIHAATLLVLLVMSCPHLQAIETQHLCGAHLVDALYLVCGERGFSFPPQIHSRPEQRRAWGENEETTFTDQMEGIGKRTIERCCSQPCSIFDLQNYCL